MPEGWYFWSMILYNVTVGIDRAIESEWVNWMKSEQIPAVMKTKIFVDFKFYKVLTHDDETTVSYCIQYFTPSLDQFNFFIKEFEPVFVEQQRAQFKDRHVAFRTLLEEV